VLASFVAACSSCLTALVPSSTPFLTSRHANGLSLGIRRYQRCGGCCDCESSSFSEREKALRREIVSVLMISLMAKGSLGLVKAHAAAVARYPY
jgi:hypothetical protein